MEISSVLVNNNYNNKESLNFYDNKPYKHNIIITPTPVKIIDELDVQKNLVSHTDTTHSTSILDDSLFIDKMGRPIYDLSRSGFFINLTSQNLWSDIGINTETETELPEIISDSDYPVMRKVKFSIDTKPETDGCFKNKYTKLGMSMEVVQAICSRRPIPMGDLAVNIGLGIAQDYTSENGELLISKITDSDMKKISRIKDADVDLFRYGLLEAKKRTSNPSPDITHIQNYQDFQLSRDGILLAKLKFIQSLYNK